MKLSKQRITGISILGLALAGLGYDRFIAGDSLTSPDTAAAAESDTAAADVPAAPPRPAALRPSQLITVSTRLQQAALLPASLEQQDALALPPSWQPKPVSVKEEVTKPTIPPAVESLMGHVSGMLRNARENTAKARIVGEIDGIKVNDHFAVGEGIGAFTIVAFDEKKRNVVLHGYGYAVTLGMDPAAKPIKVPLESP